MDMQPFKLRSRYYYAALTPEDRTYYRMIYDAWVQGSLSAELHMPGQGFVTPGGLPFGSLVEAVCNDNPHLFHLEPTHFFFERAGSRVKIWTDSVYTPAEYRAVYKSLRQKTAQILAQAEKQPDTIGKIRYLHDYLAGNVVYQNNTSTPLGHREVHTIVGALLNGACVCDGYARAFRLLCDLLGISCIVIVGEGPLDDRPGPHAWNLVKFDGGIYHTDITWDSNLSPAGALIKDFEFLLGDEAAARRHRWDRHKYPACPRDYPRREPLLDTPAKLEQAFCTHLQLHRHHFLLRLDGPLTQFSVLEREVQRICIANNALLPRCGHFRYSVYERYGYAEFTYVKDER